MNKQETESDGKKKTGCCNRHDLLSPKKPINETERLKALISYKVLDTLPEKSFDDITRLAAYICNTKRAFVTLVEKDRQFFKSRYGVDATETSRSVSFCAHAINHPEEIMIVPDATIDERFIGNPFTEKDAEFRVVFYAGVPLVDNDGFALGTLCVIDDFPGNLDHQQQEALKALAGQVISLLNHRKERIAFQKQTKMLEKTVSENNKLMHAITHDLNSPLSTVQSILGTLKEELSEYDNPEFHNYLDLGYQVTERAIGMVRGITTQAGENHKSDEYRMVDLNKVLANVRQNLFYEITHSQAKITILKALPVIIGNSHKLERVMQNILSNAIKFVETDTIPEIIIDITDKGIEWELTFCDNGIGISEGKREQIFDAFSRLPEKNQYQGVGLGLHTCKKIIQQHGGSIRVADTTIDDQTGSCFYITLPKKNV